MEVVVVQFEKVGSEHEQRARVVSWGSGAQGSLLCFMWEIAKPVSVEKYEGERDRVVMRERAEK